MRHTKADLEKAREILYEKFYEGSIPENVVTIWYQQTVEAVAVALSDQREADKQAIRDWVSEHGTLSGSAEAIEAIDSAATRKGGES